MYIGYVDKEGYILDPITCRKTGERLLRENMSLTLKMGEDVLEKEQITIPPLILSPKWGAVGKEIVFSQGKGMLFRTTHRLIFLRGPSVARELFFSKGALYEKPAEMIKAKQLRNIGAKEFIEVLFNEFVGYKKGIITGSGLCITAQGKNYALWFSPKQSKILSNIMKELKRIK